MSMLIIKHRYSGAVLWTGDAKSMREACEAAIVPCSIMLPSVVERFNPDNNIKRREARQESTMSTTISTRRKYNVRLTNTFRGPLDPVFPKTIRRMTPRQLVEAYYELKKLSGGCYVAIEIRDSDGAAYEILDMKLAL